MKTSSEHDVRVQPLDLTGAERKLGIGRGILARVAERFVKGARRAMPFLARLRSQLVPSEVSLGAPPSDSVTAGPCYLMTLTADEGAWGAVSIDTRALAIILEGTLGAEAPADEAALDGLFGKELTAAQKAVASRVSERIAIDFAQAVNAVTGIVLDIKTSQALRAGASTELPKDALRIDCHFDGLPIDAFVTLFLGADALDASSGATGGGEKAQNDPMMEQAALHVGVQVTAELGHVELGLRRLLALQPGDTLRLSTPIDEPIALCVGGVPKFDAVPVIARGQLAVQIKGRRRNES